MATEQTSDTNFDWEKTLDEPAASPVAPEKSTTPPAKPPAPAEHVDDISPNLSLLLDIPLEITAELGRTRMIIPTSCSWARARSLN